MFLHEAIEKLLKLTNGAMTATQIADELNKNKWYVKSDKSQIKPNQINARVGDHPELFEIDRSIAPLQIRLLGNKDISHTVNNFKPIRSKQLTKTVSSNIEVSATLDEDTLMNEIHFKSAGLIDKLVCHTPGLYCIRIVDTNNLPKPFNSLLANRLHNIIYIGIATESLNKRFLNQELRGNGHGTFFRSMGAILGYTPPAGSLLSKKNKRNYKFSPDHELEIIDWINNNLKVNWIEFRGDFETIETKLIEKHKPLLNIAKNPLRLSILSDLRRECVRKGMHSDS